MPRHRGPGAVDTPLPIARHLARVALDRGVAPRSVCDTAAGDGRLLSAVADLCSGSPTLFGADVDVETWDDGPLGRSGRAHFAHVDALGRSLQELWGEAPDEGIDLVVGNPPFLSQLGRDTARSDAQRARMARFGGAIRPFTDTAAAFLVQACDMLAPGGRVAMIMPLSFLSTRDGEAVRRRVLETCCLSGIWVSDGSVFPGADVETCALLLDRIDAPSSTIRRWRGASWEPVESVVVPHDELLAASTWGHLVSDVLGRVPALELDASHGRLGDLATATAGFRDQFYGLAPLVEEVDGPVAGRDDGCAPLVTSGAIDPGRLVWHDVAARIAGRRVLRPAIRPSAIDDASRLAGWVDGRRVPKVLLATQTKVVEAVADPTGEWVPSTPVVSVECDSDDVFRVLAVLMAPPVTVWARRRFAGTARSAASFKLSASQVLDIPLPPPGAPWDDATALWRSHHDVAGGGAPPSVVTGAGLMMCAAYGVGREVFDWWRGQLPAPRREQLP